MKDVAVLKKELLTTDKTDNNVGQTLIDFFFPDFFSKH
jgi:hypothetical protein